MAIEKGSFNYNNQLFYVSRKKLILGTGLFVGLAISFFNFLNVLYFLLIVTDSINNDFEPYVLTGVIKFYYQFMLSLVSVQLAFSIVYRYLLDNPKKTGERRTYKRQNRLTQQRSFNWFFVYWFFELGYILSIFLVLIKEVDFYPEYIYLVWLFVIVFLGQVWISVRPIFKKQFLGFLLTITLFSLSTFLVSFANFTNPERIRTKLLGRNLMYQNHIRVVESEFLKGRKNYEYLTSTILVPDTKEDSIYFDGEKIGITDLAREIFRMRENYMEIELEYLNMALHIDKNVKMNKITLIKDILIKMGANRISYMFRKPDNMNPFYFKSKVGFPIRLPEVGGLNNDLDAEEAFSIRVLDSDRVLFQQDTINHQVLRDRLKEQILNGEVKPYEIIFKTETPFKSYFKTLESTYSVMMYFRNELSQKGYTMDYDFLPRDSKNQIKKQYWWHVIDLLEK